MCATSAWASSRYCRRASWRLRARSRRGGHPGAYVSAKLWDAMCVAPGGGGARDGINIERRRDVCGRFTLKYCRSTAAVGVLAAAFIRGVEWADGTRSSTSRRATRSSSDGLETASTSRCARSTSRLEPGTRRSRGRECAYNRLNGVCRSRQPLPPRRDPPRASSTADVSSPDGARARACRRRRGDGPRDARLGRHQRPQDSDAVEPARSVAASRPLREPHRRPRPRGAGGGCERSAPP